VRRVVIGKKDLFVVNRGITSRARATRGNPRGIPYLHCRTRDEPRYPGAGRFSTGCCSGLSSHSRTSTRPGPTQPGLFLLCWELCWFQIFRNSTGRAFRALFRAISLGRGILTHTLDLQIRTHKPEVTGSIPVAGTISSFSSSIFFAESQDEDERAGIETHFVPQ